MAKISGRTFLFLGIETKNWTLAQFGAAALFARDYHIDSLLVKCGDGTDEWYSNWPDIRESIHKVGVGAIPYFYMYGESLGGHPAFETEVKLLLEYMGSDGIVCADIEAQFQNNPAWGIYITSMMKPKPGTFLVTTFADPNEISTSYGSLIHNLSPCVDAFLPQEYDTYLSLKWPDFGVDGASCLFPVIDMTNEFGANDALGIAKNAHMEGHAAIGIWEYATALNNKPLVQQIISTFPPVAATQEDKNMTTQALAIWNSSLVSTQHLNPTSLIAEKWMNEYFSGTNFGPALSGEINTVDESGKPIIFQTFAYGFITYQTGTVTVHGAGIKL